MSRLDENVFAQIFEAGPDGELVVAADGRVRLANPEAHRILGWPPGTLTEHSLDELLPERFDGEHGRPVTAYPRSSSTERVGPTRDGLVTHRRDGTEIPVEISLSEVRDGSEQLFHIAIRDVTTRDAPEQQLRDIEETFRLLDGVRDYAIFLLDPEGHIMTWNAGAERIKGYRANEIIGQSFVRLYLPQDVIAGLPSQLLHHAAEHGVSTHEGARLRKDGSQFWAHVVVTALHDKSGALRGFAKITRDISDEKHAEQSMAILADASRRLAESLDSEQILFAVAHMAVPAFADALLIHLRDPQGNPRLELFRAATPELHGAVRDLQRSGAIRAAAPSRRVMKTGRSELSPKLTPEWFRGLELDDEQVQLMQKFGISSTMHVPLILDGRPFAVIVFAATGTRIYNEHDLVFAEELARRASTALQNAELFRTANQERERAEEAAMLRERLVAVLGHDLRTPLTSIIMGADMLSSSALTTIDKQVASRILISANRMARMIGQILDFARIRSGQTFALQLQPADLHQVCDAVIDEILLSHPNEQITLIFEGAADAVVDPDRIAQVLSNLIGNAIQHGERGPITVTVRDASPDAVAIEVHNVGRPIPKAAQAALFDAFHRETAPGSFGSSIGLGLFIAREITRAHGGTIAVRSPDRNGTTFSVTLPRGQVDIGESAAESAPHVH